MGKTVGLFIPCFVDQLYPQVGLDTVRVLRRAGYEVSYPEEQTCCGQPAFNTGYWNEAIPLAQRFLEIFQRFEAVVCPSGSCATMVRKFYPELLKGTPSENDAAAVGGRVFELSEFLIHAGVTDLGACFPYRVSVHDSCHALRELGVKAQPRELLRHVRGLELAEMNDAEECCGFGGTFAVKMASISAAMGQAKAEHLKATDAQYVTAVDSSCLMHLEGILRRRGDAAKTIHLASILAAGYERPE